MDLSKTRANRKNKKTLTRHEFRQVKPTCLLGPYQSTPNEFFNCSFELSSNRFSNSLFQDFLELLKTSQRKTTRNSRTLIMISLLKTFKKIQQSRHNCLQDHLARILPANFSQHSPSISPTLFWRYFFKFLSKFLHQISQCRGSQPVDCGPLGSRNDFSGGLRNHFTICFPQRMEIISRILVIRFFHFP